MAGHTAKAQYATFATSYDLVWGLPAVRPLLPLLTSTLGSIDSRLKVLDLACGTGMGLRLLQSLGAKELVGVDISSQMLEIAKATTPSATLYTADCTLPLDHLGLEPSSFDIVLGMWLLNYCPSYVELAGMWKNIATYLKPGGKFVGIIENHDIVHPAGVRDFKYGGAESNLNELENGEGWSVHVAFQTEPKIEFDAFRLRKEILEREAANANLHDITYTQPSWEDIRTVIAEGVGADAGKDESWWTELVEEPPNYVLTARKP